MPLHWSNVLEYRILETRNAPLFLTAAASVLSDPRRVNVLALSELLLSLQTY